MLEQIRDTLGLNNIQLIGILAGILLFLSMLSFFLRISDNRILRFFGSLIKWTLISAFALTVAFIVLPKKFTIWAIDHKFLGLVAYVGAILLITILFSWMGEGGESTTTYSKSQAPKSPKTKPDRYLVADRRFKDYGDALRYSNYLKKNNITPNNIVNL